jgi:ATP-dependent Clp protease ATP-binding subunit ClpA
MTSARIRSKSIHAAPCGINNVRRNPMGLISKFFSPAAKLAPDFAPILAVAAVESAGFGHNYIGTEHVLCALIRAHDTTLDRIFAQFGLQLGNVRESVLYVARAGSRYALEISRPQTPRLNRILQSSRANGATGKNVTAPQLLLLGIVHEGNGVAIRALRSLSVNLERLRQELEAPNQYLSTTDQGKSGDAEASGQR